MERPDYKTVSEKDNKWYHGFISKWFKKSGVPIVLNTSFNDREPIVENPEHYKLLYGN